MKKRFLLTLLVIAISIIAFGTISVSAATSGTCGNNLTWTLDDSGTLTISGTGNMTDFSGSTSSPWNKYGVKKVIVKNGVKSIGKYAFYDHYYLTEVSMSDTVSKIYASAFYKCEKLETITLSSNLTTIDEFAFSGCTKLSNISLPKSLTWIGGHAFENCESITSIDIPEGVWKIDYWTFNNCSSLKNVSIPSTVTTIEFQAFAGCTSVECYDVSDNNSNYCDIDGSIFNKNGTKILWYALGKSDSYYALPESVTSIDSSAFRGSRNLKHIHISSDSYFSLSFPMFDDCEKLEKITVNENSKEFSSIDGVLFDKSQSILYRYPIGKSNKSYTIPDSVGTIDYQAFTDSKLQEINFGKNTKLIDDYAFSFCESLTSITIPDSVTSIGKSAFYFSDLEEVILGNGITSITDSAFLNCADLTSVTIPNSVTTIGESAFSGCKKLSVVNYNGTATSWELINIKNYNSYLTNASRNYFWYVTYIDKSGDVINKDMVVPNTLALLPEISIPEGYKAQYYLDENLTTLFDFQKPITENVDIYIEIFKPNAIKIEGDSNADIGQQGIIQKVSFTTDKTAKYFSCTLKVPNGLEVQEIKSDIFEIEQDYEKIDNDTHYYLFLIYNGDGNIPTHKTLNAFEVVFDASENAAADGILTIEILDDAILADDNGNSYKFTSIEKAEIKINPILTEKITIVGADEIDAPTQYTASVLPENVTNQNVEWSVSDETIATISEDGVLTPVKKGNVTVRATAKDGSGICAEKTVSVKVLGTVNSITTNIGIWDKEYSPDTTNYTIYVPESTTSIRLTAKHDGTFKTDKTTFVNNVTRPVTLSTTSDETVLDLAYTCDGYDDNKYTITIIKFEGTKTEVSEDKKSFGITPINVENGKTVILALYNGEQFVEMQSAVYTGEIVPFTTTKTYTKANVMIWDDITNLKPICEVENIQ